MYADGGHEAWKIGIASDVLYQGKSVRALFNALLEGPRPRRTCIRQQKSYHFFFGVYPVHEHCSDLFNWSMSITVYSKVE